MPRYLLVAIALLGIAPSGSLGGDAGERIPPLDNRGPRGRAAASYPQGQGTKRQSVKAPARAEAPSSAPSRLVKRKQIARPSVSPRKEAGGRAAPAPSPQPGERPPAPLEGLRNLWVIRGEERGVSGGEEGRPSSHLTPSRKGALTPPPGREGGSLEREDRSGSVSISPEGRAWEEGDATPLVADFERYWRRRDPYGIASLLPADRKVRLSAERTGLAGSFSPGQAIYVLKDLLSTGEEVSFEVQRFRTPPEARGTAYAVGVRRYRLSSSGEPRTQKIFLSLVPEQGRWVIEEIRVTE